MDKDVFVLVDVLVNYPKYLADWLHTKQVFSQRLGHYAQWYELAAFEQKVVEWSKEHPVIWNVGIGPGASFVPTLTRLLLERINDIHGPYDQITHVRVPPPVEGASSSAAEHQLVFEVLKEIHDDSMQLQELKQLATEESYFGYGKISGYLILQAFGGMYINKVFWSSDRSVRMDPIYDRQAYLSPIRESIREALQEGKRHLLVVENLHVPTVLLSLLPGTMGDQYPSVFRNRRWLISATSKDVCENSRRRHAEHDLIGPDLMQEYFYAPPFDDLGSRDWAVLIKEALQDTARSIYNALQVQDKGEEEFWLHVAQHCLYYAILYHPLKRHHTSNTSSVTSEELVRCWVAEDLIFSTAITPSTPAAPSQKQSNYYRSAYEAGKVVMQALQEYSLLPIYSVSSSAGSTTSSEETSSALSSSQDAVTGVSKLAEDVPRLKEDELNSHLNMSNQPRWVSFMNDDGRHVSWDWKPRKTENTVMTTLILRGSSNISEFPLDKLLTPHLRVLDLSYTPISSLPPSLSSLLNLHLLNLRGCSHLETLSTPPTPDSDKETSPLAHLENVQVLDMNGVPLLELTQQDGSKKRNLHCLDLSGSKFTTLPSEFFSEMSSLEELFFGNCTNLREFPPSMAQLSNLLVLLVEGTQVKSFPEHIFQKMQSLHTLMLINNVLLKSLPMSLSQAKGLKELHISNCAGLILESLWELVLCLEVEDLHIHTWKSMENIKIHGHPTLRTFSLSGPWIRCLSLCGCSKLKIVNFSDDLTALENVDLSRTGLVQVHHNLPNLPRLRMLLLRGVPYSMRFPWHLLVRFPKIFYLDHCAYDDDNCQEGEKTTNTAQININDPRMFHNFNADVSKKLVKEGRFLQSFHVRVKPGSKPGNKALNNEIGLSSRIHRHSGYDDVQCSDATSIIPIMTLHPKQRHVEISAVNQYPNGLRHIFSVTNSIFITDDAFVRCLTDLSYSLNDLKECQLQRCHQMTIVFLMRSQGSEALPYLQRLQVFDLNNLLSFVEPSDLSYSYFITLKLLKHIHLEHCPRLQKMFPCSLSLPALETLVILFCSSLKTIYYKQASYAVEPSPLPSIKRICLQELPQLLHFHDVTFRFETPKWEKLFVRGCHSFHHLPLLKTELPKSKVEVSGEREWWDRLELKLPEQSDYYMHVAPPKFVSRKKHIIESYLR